MQRTGSKRAITRAASNRKRLLVKLACLVEPSGGRGDAAELVERLGFANWIPTAAGQGQAIGEHFLGFMMLLGEHQGSAVPLKTQQERVRVDCFAVLERALVPADEFR